MDLDVALKIYAAGDRWKKKKASHLLGYSPTDGAVKGARLINVATHGGVYVQMTPSVE